jgi:hypothetical protein
MSKNKLALEKFRICKLLDSSKSNIIGGTATTTGGGTTEDKKKKRNCVANSLVYVNEATILVP